ncbi:S-adenosyl-l-methionine hydroxide adenosyltransferase family protein [Acidobacteriota bacterium]
MKSPVIALMTDFGEKDFFVASLKGVILGINPESRIIDITHRIPSFDILAGSFVLYAAHSYFPSFTIFLAIVDPGVGSSRRIILAETKDHFFICPDNGVLSLVLETERIKSIREITNKRFFLSELSATFEGRDKMAPAAAWLSRGTPLEEFGKRVSKYEELSYEKPRIKENMILGRILYVDKFGNLITNIQSDMVDLLRDQAGSGTISVFAGNSEVSSFKNSYSSTLKGELLFLKGSLGLMEIAARESSAADLLNIKPKDNIKIIAKAGRS